MKGKMSMENLIELKEEKERGNKLDSWYYIKMNIFIIVVRCYIIKLTILQMEYINGDDDDSSTMNMDWMLLCRRMLMDFYVDMGHALNECANIDYNNWMERKIFFNYIVLHLALQ